MNPEYTEPLDTCPLCGTDDVLYPSITKQYKDEIELLNKADKLQDDNERLREALRELSELSGDCVEYSDWPELQKAIEKAYNALKGR